MEAKSTAEVWWSNVSLEDAGWLRRLVADAEISGLEIVL
jgi:hypothetical protein